MFQLTPSVLALVIVFFSASLVHGYANPGVCTGACNLHDPSLIQRDDGKWFKFTSHNLVGVSTADDISGPWADAGSVLVNRSVIDLPGNTDIWAPDVHKIGDKYYCYYAVSVFGTQESAIGLAISPNMEPGTWEDKGVVLRSTEGDLYNAIDPAFIQTPEGNMYMSFGSYANGLFVVELETPEKPTGSIINTSFNTSSTRSSEEGSYIYYRNEYYYLFYSTGNCCGYNPDNLPAPGEEYRINVCRSTSITGPYVDQDGVSCLEAGGTTVLASHDNVYGPGGQGVYENILYYHYVDTESGGWADMQKFFGYNVLQWENDWPVV